MGRGIWEVKVDGQRYLGGEEAEGVTAKAPCMWHLGGEEAEGDDEQGPCTWHRGGEEAQGSDGQGHTVQKGLLERCIYT